MLDHKFSLARGSIREKYLTLKFPQLITVNVSAEA